MTGHTVHRLQSLGSRGVCVLISHAAAMRYAGQDSVLHVYIFVVLTLYLAIQWFIIFEKKQPKVIILERPRGWNVVPIASH